MIHAHMQNAPLPPILKQNYNGNVTDVDISDVSISNNQT